MKKDISFLEKLLPARLLTVEKGKVDLKLHALGIRLADINLELRDFSSNKGGAVSFRSTVEISWKEKTILQKSDCTGRFD